MNTPPPSTERHISGHVYHDRHFQEVHELHGCCICPADRWWPVTPVGECVKCRRPRLRSMSPVVLQLVSERTLDTWPN